MVLAWNFYEFERIIGGLFGSFILGESSVVLTA